MRNSRRATEDMEIKIIGFDANQQDRRQQSWEEQLAAAKPTVPEPPEDPDLDPKWGPTNSDRAQWGGLALRTFSICTGSDLCDALADMIADLGHWCDRHGLKMSEEIARGREMYEYETQNQGTQFE